MAKSRPTATKSSAKAATKVPSKSSPKPKPTAKPSKPEAKKPTVKEAAPKKADAKKPDLKIAAKPELKKSDAKKVEGKRPETKKPDAKKPEIKKPEIKKAEIKKPELKKAEVKAPESSKIPRKGITVVNPRPPKKDEAKTTLQMPTFGAPLLKAGAKPKPLISSGPDAVRKQLHIDDGTVPKKTPFDKRELERYRQLLLKKRAELIGDVNAMEAQALQGGSSGSLSHTPQHMAEQGTDTFEQALSLDLAATDRKLIKEIGEALKRIDAGTYGVCELTGKPIKLERLEELPWARYSIEAQRELERRATMPVVP